VRPSRHDIAAPELPPRLRWLNGQPTSMSALLARGPVLVHFFDYAHLNSVRALPYLVAWNERYAAAGLATLGVHSPRFGFTAEESGLAEGVERLGLDHPVADDSAYALWHDYGVEGWPSLFLWGVSGALSWFHFGEGEYQATELAIQGELRVAGVDRALPQPLAPLRPSDGPGVLVAAPTEELLPGGHARTPWSATEGAAIELAYEAGGAHASVDGGGALDVALDDGPAHRIDVGGPGLYRLSEHPVHEAHRLRIDATPGVRVWSVSFEAAPPG
jgi:hypothetical protein